MKLQLCCFSKKTGKMMFDSLQLAESRVPCVCARVWVVGGRSIPALPRQYRTGFKLLRALMKVAAYCPADRWFLT